MGEKVLITTEGYNAKKIAIIVGIIITILSIIITNIFTLEELKRDYFGEDYKTYYRTEMREDPESWADEMDGFWQSFENDDKELPFFGPIVKGGIHGTIIGFLIYLVLSCELTATDKRVLIKGMWQKAVLPINSVSAVSTFYKSIYIGTSGGRIYLPIIKNNDEVYEVLNLLLIEKQSEKTE